MHDYRAYCRIQMTENFVEMCIDGGLRRETFQCNIPEIRHGSWPYTKVVIDNISQAMLTNNLFNRLLTPLSWIKAPVAPAVRARFNDTNFPILSLAYVIAVIFCGGVSLLIILAIIWNELLIKEASGVLLQRQIHIRILISKALDFSSITSYWLFQPMAVD